MPAEFRVRVIAVIEGLRPGEVVSYGDVAAQAGYPGAARGVGSILAATEGLAWWRVVMANGSLAPGKEREQGRRLRAEGVKVLDGRVEGRSRPRGGRSPRVEHSRAPGPGAPR